MRRIGQALTALGVLSIVAPLFAIISRFVGGPEFAMALSRAPTFVLGGILLFVIGTAVRIFAT